MMKKIIPALGAALILALVPAVMHNLPAPAPEAPPRGDPVKEALSKMTPEEKIGQLLIAGFPTAALDAHIQTLIRDHHIGGVNLLKRNIVDKAQTIRLTSSLQDFNRTYNSIPLLIGADQEGGSVVRFPFLKELAAQRSVRSEDAAYALAYRRGRELKNLGINANFSPVLDYVTDPSSYLYPRTFATSSESTARLAEAMIKGYRDAGIVAVPKHYPGYGNILRDPHKYPVTVENADLETMLTAFKRVAAGGEARALMSSHAVIASADEKPATLSAHFMTEILRDEWKFKGVLISDDLEMASASLGKDIGEIAVEAVNAGNDMVIVTFGSDNHLRVLEALGGAVAAGVISQERLDEAVYRILTLKSYLSPPNNP